MPKKGPHRQGRLPSAFPNNVKKPGKYLDGDGLMLIVDQSEAKRWVQRLVINGRRRDIGHGSFKHVSLKEARLKAAAASKLAREGGDPLAERQRERGVDTFEELARKVHELKRPTWKNPKHGDQWINTLRTYVFPKLGDRRVSDISKSDVLSVLEPIWTSKHETASRVRQRMGEVFKRAIALDWRQDNPAEAVKATLPRVSRGSINHYKALDYNLVNHFIIELRQRKAWPVTKLAYEFLILTALRTGEIRGALWSEIDLAKAEWFIPRERMKAKADHRVPLTPRMLEILTEAKDYAADGGTLVFPSQRGDRMLSDNTFRKLNQSSSYDIDVHGFRSTFRTWAQDKTDFAREVVEAALSHQEQDAVVAAYARSDLFAKRRSLMEQWEAWCLG